MYSLFQCLTVNLNTNQRTVDLNTNQQVKSLIPLLACMGCIEPSPKAFFISLLSAQTPDSSGPERVGTRPSCIGYLNPYVQPPPRITFSRSKTANSKCKEENYSHYHFQFDCVYNRRCQVENLSISKKSIQKQNKKPFNE